MSSFAGCSLPHPRKRKFYSQSNEDWTLFNLFFASPTVCKGTFLELGALDGVKYSNTKFFEDTLGWKGVLIEANPNNYRLLSAAARRPNSKKYFGAVCSDGQKYINMSFRDTKAPLAVGGDVTKMTKGYKTHFIREGQKQVEVPCKPLSEYLHEAGIRHIDLFSLDVEGSELLVLSTMDWAIPVKVFVIEFNRETRKLIENIMLEHGYVQSSVNLEHFCLPGKDCASNLIFVSKHYKYSFSQN